jgi:hypothetical protein
MIQNCQTIIVLRSQENDDDIFTMGQKSRFVKLGRNNPVYKKKIYILKAVTLNRVGRNSRFVGRGSQNDSNSYNVARCRHRDGSFDRDGDNVENKNQRDNFK